MATVTVDARYRAKEQLYSREVVPRLRGGGGGGRGRGRGGGGGSGRGGRGIHGGRRARVAGAGGRRAGGGRARGGGKRGRLVVLGGESSFVQYVLHVMRLRCRLDVHKCNSGTNTAISARVRARTRALHSTQ